MRVLAKPKLRLRAAFLVACAGKQVVMIAPTTLLARQHYQTFIERFSGFGFKIAELSRLVSAKQAGLIKQDLANGKIDIVIGTHSVLGKSVDFQNLGLLIIDEEQHFGVKQKEKLKAWSNLHILTMTATPIPRSLNFALSGLRDLSLLATPPVDRLSVRVFVSPFDSMILTEAIKRERLRGGQIFCVCPRIADLARVEHQILQLAPDISYHVAHGQMPVKILEEFMQKFTQGQTEMLLSTNIVESGLDIRRANTMLIFRPEKFGLSQLYQLRGRVGRGKLRGYCYLIMSQQSVNAQTQKRMQIIQSLDSVGAGFQIASHDMDLRGAGNLLGEAQSGKINEIGMELYHTMLKKALAQVQGQSSSFNEEYSPQVKLDISVRIPENYVQDLPLRMGLYQRLSKCQTVEEIDEFQIEMIDRFGKMPINFEYLVQVMKLRVQCKWLNIAKLEVGEKGLVIGFRDNHFANPNALLDLIQKNPNRMQLLKDQSVYILENMTSPAQRLKRAQGFLNKLRSLLPSDLQNG